MRDYFYETASRSRGPRPSARLSPQDSRDFSKNVRFAICEGAKPLSIRSFSEELCGEKRWLENTLALEEVPCDRVATITSWIIRDERFTDRDRAVAESWLADIYVSMLFRRLLKAGLEGKLRDSRATQSPGADTSAYELILYLRSHDYEVPRHLGENFFKQSEPLKTLLEAPLFERASLSKKLRVKLTNTVLISSYNAAVAQLELKRDTLASSLEMPHRT